MLTQLLLYCILRAARKMLLVVGTPYSMSWAVRSQWQQLLCRAASTLALYMQLMAAMAGQELRKSWWRGLVVRSRLKGFGKKSHKTWPVLHTCFAQEGHMRSQVGRSSEPAQ